MSRILKEMQFIEHTDRKFEEPIAIIGLPDVGLVGAIATVHLTRELKIPEHGYAYYDLIPPVILLHEGELKAPVRIYANEKIITLISEISLPTQTILALSKKIVHWVMEKKGKYILMLSGLGVPNRMDIEEPKVYGVATHMKGKKLLQENGIETLQEGFIAGANALILRECIKNEIPAILLLSESFTEFPDPAAAASILKAFGKITGIQIDTKKLIEQAEEIRIKARELMRRTQRQLKAMRKIQESEAPLMYR